MRCLVCLLAAVRVHACTHGAEVDCAGWASGQPAVTACLRTGWDVLPCTPTVHATSLEGRCRDVPQESRERALRHQRALWQRDGLCMCVIVESMGQIAFVTEVCVNCSKQQPAEAQRRNTLGRIRGKVQRAAAPRASSPSCKLKLFHTSPWSNLSHRPWLRGRTLLTHVQRTAPRNLEMLNWTRTKSRQRTCSNNRALLRRDLRLECGDGDTRMKVICGHPHEHWPGAAPWDGLRPLYHRVEDEHWLLWARSASRREDFSMCAMRPPCSALFC